MNWQTQCAAVIPCLNESRTIGSLVRSVSEHLHGIYVVDDGSKDGTAEVARQAGGLVLGHPRTQGKGAALRTGWNQARRAGFSWALTMDGDGQHCAQDIPAFFAAAERTSAALVVGNRMPNAHAMPWLRRWVNRWMSRRLSALAGQDLADSQCGFRLINLDAWARLGIETTHFEIESEVLLAFVQCGYLVDFVPIRVIYKAEQSKIDPWHDTLRWLRWWWQVSRQPARPGARPSAAPPAAVPQRLS